MTDSLTVETLKALAEERKTLRGLKRGVDQGVRTMDDVKHHYQSWTANAEYAGDAPIRAMDHFYTVTFRQKPEYKRKRRYLYGGKDDKQRIRELERENERLKRELEEARATTEYVAMMADVELEEEA